MDFKIICEYKQHIEHFFNNVISTSYSSTFYLYNFKIIFLKNCNNVAKYYKKCTQYDFIQIFNVENYERCSVFECKVNDENIKKAVQFIIEKKE